MYSLVRPVLFQLDAETAHNSVFKMLRLAGPTGRMIASLVYGQPNRRLVTNLAGMQLAGPLGLAAGLDKNGVLARFWPVLGFGFVEMGTVTAHAQPGNPKPRMFRFPSHGALVNRMGFNNEGSEVLAERLIALGNREKSVGVPLGVNLGKSKITELEDAAEDYVTSTKRVADHCEYLVVNVSSPNTPGLRKLQDPEFLKDITAKVKANSDVPVFVKLAPDLADEGLKHAVDVATQAGASGIIATNTTIDHHGIADVGAGGLSGRPLAKRSLEVIRAVSNMTDLPIIGVGGIANTEDAIAAIAAGAHAVQIYSALIFEGPGLVSRINAGIIQEMDKRGIETFDEFRTALQSA
jgi:dihydroorotate dehydrogenase